VGGGVGGGGGGGGGGGRCVLWHTEIRLNTLLVLGTTTIFKQFF